MEYIKGQPRNQIIIVTECLEDYISENNPVRVIDTFVDNLDMEAACFLCITLADNGRPSIEEKQTQVD